MNDRNSHQGSKYTDPGSITSTSSPQKGDVGLVQYHQPKAAEYPFQTNLCMPPQGVNFDLTHKRGNFTVIFLIYYNFFVYHTNVTDISTDIALRNYENIILGYIAVEKSV